MKTKCTRGIIYFIGLIVLALGIVLNTKTLLGVSPIISIPYNICHIWHLNLGAITFVFYCFCVSGIIGLVFTRHIIGLGIGIVLAVIFTGRVIAVYNYFLKHPMQNLAGIAAEL